MIGMHLSKCDAPESDHAWHAVVWISGHRFGVSGRTRKQAFKQAWDAIYYMLEVMPMVGEA